MQEDKTSQKQEREIRISCVTVSTRGLLLYTCREHFHRNLSKSKMNISDEFKWHWKLIKHQSKAGCSVARWSALDVTAGCCVVKLGDLKPPPAPGSRSAGMIWLISRIHDHKDILLEQHSRFTHQQLGTQENRWLWWGKESSTSCLTNPQTGLWSFLAEGDWMRRSGSFTSTYVTCFFQTCGWQLSKGSDSHQLCQR